MNQIAQQLKERNIAEYLIYMWQEEDLIRANHCEPEELETNVIVRYPEDQRAAMREWYGNLITMMSEEGVREKGHLQINKNVILNLTELHNALSSSPKFPFYSAAYFKALPFIVELRTKNGKKDLQIHLAGISGIKPYMTWLLFISKTNSGDLCLSDDLRLRINIF